MLSEPYSINLQKKVIKNSPGIVFMPKREDKSTSSFISKQQRFQQKSIHLTPGPGSYDYKQSKNKYHIQPSKQSPIKKQFQWIVQDHCRMTYVPLTSNTLGPGSYNLKDSHHLSQNTNWGKSDRFKELQQSIKLGPGSYNSTDLKTKSPSASSVFKSKTNKSFIEQLIKDRSKTQITPKQQVKFIENPQNTSEKKLNLSKNKSKQSSSFASNIPRFSKQHLQKLGPGYYEVDIVKSVKNKFPKLITIKDTKKQIKPKKIDNPGPGYYEVSIDQPDKQKGITICKQQRFKQKMPDKQPGPGQYNQNRFTYLFSNTSKLYDKNAPFSSTSQRIDNILPSKQNPFGTYNLNMYNLDYKCQRQRQHLQKLKIMEVQIPAFNSKQKK